MGSDEEGGESMAGDLEGKFRSVEMGRRFAEEDLGNRRGRRRQDNREMQPKMKVEEANKERKERIHTGWIPTGWFDTGWPGRVVERVRT